MIKCMILHDQIHDAWRSNALWLFTKCLFLLIIKHHQASSRVIQCHQALWRFMTLYDDIWCFMMLHDASWHFMMLYDTSWHFMTFHEISWHFMTFHDSCCNTLDVIMNDLLRFWGFDHHLDLIKLCEYYLVIFGNKY